MTVAGRDLRDYRQEDIRRAISVAAPLLGEHPDNVRLPRPDASDWEIEQALRRARI